MTDKFLQQGHSALPEKRLTIAHIPAVLYGKSSRHVFLYIHGKNGCKEEARAFAEQLAPGTWQVLAIDLPGHGERKAEAAHFDPFHVPAEIYRVYCEAERLYDTVSLYVNSIGAWFSMLALAEKPLEKCLFVSPILDMAELICRMMQWADVTEEQLKQAQSIETAFGETLSYPYLQYAKEHPIDHWHHPTAILYAGGDNLTPRPTVMQFVRRFQDNCSLSIMESGEHWFHTPEQLEVLYQWLQKELQPPC